MGTHKTPISLLQEICVKRGITPTYELVSNEGPIHEPLFMYKCSAGDWSTKAKGTSKKKAKHQAAYLVLMKMFNNAVTTEAENQMIRELQTELGDCLAGGLGGLEGPGGGAGVTGLGGGITGVGGAGFEDGNPVGELQELCQRNMWPQPTYEFAMTNGPNHSRDYGCSVTLWKWSETGCGKSKKLAKRRAAQDLLVRITRDNLTIPQSVLDMMEEENLPIVSRNELQTLQKTKEPSFDEMTARFLTRTMKGIWTRRGKKLPEISVDFEDTDLEPEKSLEDLADKHGFSIFYTYITKTKSNRVHSMIQLSTQPVHVVKGTGDSLESARRRCALQCLVYLVTMTAKTPIYPFAGEAAFETIPAGDCTELETREIKEETSNHINSTTTTSTAPLQDPLITSED